MPKLAGLLRELRGKRPLREIAEQSGLSISYISDLEHARRPVKPSTDTLRSLAHAYRHPLRELMAAAGASDEEIELAVQAEYGRTLSDFEHDILTKLANLSPDARELVRESVNRLFKIENKDK